MTLVLSMLSFIKFAAHQSRIESMSDCRSLSLSLIIIVAVTGMCNCRLKYG
jgi:hypothetical protein